MTQVTEWPASLSQPFDPSQVKWRPGPKTKDGTKAQALAYVDARDVMDRLDAAVTAGGWSDYYQVLDVQGRPAVKATLVVLGISKEDVGYSNGADDEDPLKGAFSDAFKRAAVKFGIGRELYDSPKFWLPLVNGRFDAYPTYVVGRGWVAPNSTSTPISASSGSGTSPGYGTGWLASDPTVAPEPLRRKMFASFKGAGLTPDQGLAFAQLALLPKPVHTTKGLSIAEVDIILEKLNDKRLVGAAQSVLKVWPAEATTAEVAAELVTA